MPIRINRLTSSEGRAVDIGRFVVLVGPNNCGKSQTLRDIRDYIVTGTSKATRIINDIDVSFPPQEQVTASLSMFDHPNQPDQVVYKGVSYDLNQSADLTVREGWIENNYSNIDDASRRTQILKNLGQFWVAHLDAEGRFRLASPRESYDPRTESPSNAIQAFYAGGSPALQQLRRAFYDAFGMDIALDWAGLRTFNLRVGNDFGEIPDSREALDELLKGAEELAKQGDGYRSFAGVALSMLTFSDRLLLLDEPDAFLHPAQARALGRWMADYSSSRTSQIIVATHSADFLWGLISSGAPIEVIRLNRQDDTTRYHVAGREILNELARSPLLSSQPVLDSLFHMGVVVCEGDPDRAVYQTVAHEDLREGGGEEVLFIHSNGKDTMAAPIQLLRKSGTPVRAIVDIDVINSARVFGDLIESLTGSPVPGELDRLREEICDLVDDAEEMSILDEMRQDVRDWQSESFSELREARRRLKSIYGRASKWGRVKENGTEYFTCEGRDKIHKLIGDCKERGLFVVHKGELEGWMDLGARKGKKWNRLALEKLHDGGCPEELRSFVAAVVGSLWGSGSADRVVS